MAIAYLNEHEDAQKPQARMEQEGRIGDIRPQEFRCRIEPYLHHGRLLTWEDTVEFLNLIWGVQFTEQAKQDLVAVMRALQGVAKGEP